MRAWLLLCAAAQRGAVLAAELRLRIEVGSVREEADVVASESSAWALEQALASHLRAAARVLPRSLSWLDGSHKKHSAYRTALAPEVSSVTSARGRRLQGARRSGGLVDVAAVVVSERDPLFLREPTFAEAVEARDSGAFMNRFCESPA